MEYEDEDFNVTCDYNEVWSGPGLKCCRDFERKYCRTTISDTAICIDL